MRQTLTSPRGMVTAPHHLAAGSACAVLREGGNAIEAMVAGAATIAVVYPHMNAIGGDGFWLISEPGQAPVAIDACGRAPRQSIFIRAKGSKPFPVAAPWQPTPWPVLFRAGKRRWCTARAWAANCLPLACCKTPFGTPAKAHR